MVSAVGLFYAYRSGTPLACCAGTPFTCCLGTLFAICSGTPFPPFDRSSKRMMRGGASVLGGGATGAPSSSDHSDIATLYVRVVRSPPSEISLGLWGVAPSIFLFFQASSSIAALFPGLSPTPGEDSPSNQRLRLQTPMRH